MVGPAPKENDKEPMTVFTRRVLTLTAVLVLALVGTASAHTLFLKLESFFLDPNSRAEVELVNGDFDLSEFRLGPRLIGGLESWGTNSGSCRPSWRWRGGG